MDLFVCDGRPVTKERRLAKEVRTYDLLDELKIPFKRIDHETAMTIADCDEVDHLFGCKIYKNLFLRNSKGDEYYRSSLAPPDCLLQMRNIWRNFLTLLPAQ